MKKLFLCAATLSLLAGPAFAASTTISFETADMPAQTATFSDDGTMTSDAGEGTYTFDEATGKLCVETTTYTGCLTFEDPKHEVGDVSTYTTETGETGTATILSKEE